MDISILLRRSTLLSMAFITTLLAGCGGDGSDSEVMNVTVGDKPVTCGLGVFSQLMFCSPPAYRTDNGEREISSQHIEGFEHEFGVAYELRIQMDHIAEPLQDASSVSYKLLSIISSTQVAQPGDIYTFEIPLNGDMFRMIDGNTFIGPYQFTCGEGVDCQQLIDMDVYGSNGLVTIEFTYTGAEAPIELTFWN